MKISDLDRNLKVETHIQQENLRFFDVREAPFEIDGVIPNDEAGNGWHRIPDEVAQTVSPGVRELNRLTAGGRIRFRTDSPFVALKVDWPKFWKMPHMPYTGTSGFSLYRVIDGVQTFWSTFIPGEETGYESILRPGAPGMTDFILYLPLFNEISHLYIGLDENCHIEAPTPYTVSKPIVFYGSSITHGGCASRPGMDYEGILSRMLDADYVNLGFSGNACGETSMAEYIAGLDMSMFVLDYDHNAPNVEHLQKTHEAFFNVIRTARPELPILMVSRPQKILSEWDRLRREVIRTTYENAICKGDRHVYFLDGSQFFGELDYNDATVDGIHPTDLGFYCMAKGMYPVIRQAIADAPMLLV